MNSIKFTAEEIKKKKTSPQSSTVKKKKIRKWTKHLNRHFTDENIQMTNKGMKRHSTSLAIREVQVKTTKRYHYTPIRMIKIKNSDDTKCWQGCGETGSLLHCWCECKMVQPFWKTVSFL